MDHSHPPSGKKPLARSLVVWLGAAGVGSAAATTLPTSAAAAPPVSAEAAAAARAELEARVAAVRRQLDAARARLAGVAPEGPPEAWNNWPKWSNWANWANG